MGFFGILSSTSYKNELKIKKEMGILRMQKNKMLKIHHQLLQVQSMRTTTILASIYGLRNNHPHHAA